MLDIIGNIKIDESKPERVDYFLACLKSWTFFREHCSIFLNLNEASEDLYNRTCQTIGEMKIEDWRVLNNVSEQYGKKYCELLGFDKNPFVLNFIEDHFALLDDAEKMLALLNQMKESKVDVLKTSFFRIEQNSQRTLRGITHTGFGKIFQMNESNYKEYSRHYKGRFMLGVNFLTTRAFALKFWNRDCGPRPHEYEINDFSQKWEHTCMIPSFEILAAVDDNHGEEGTCLLMRKESKWEKLKVKSEKLKVEQPKEPVIASAAKQSHSENFSFNNLKAENEIYKKAILKRFEAIHESGIYLFGEQTKELETRFAKYIGKKYCITVKNCTDAIMLALKYILRIHPHRPVILPNFGAYPTAIAAKNCTDKIHFVDVDESLTIDVNKLPNIKNAIIIPVHLFGNNCNMKAISKYAQENNHIIIEDCAQSCGSGSGSIGDFSVFSFYPTKPLGTIGDGGAICTDDEEAYHELLKMRFYGLDNDEIKYSGMNSRMGELECAVVNAKLGSFEKFSEKRCAIASRYKKIISGIRINYNCIYHQFPVLFNEREKCIAALNEKEIPFMIHYPKHISEMPLFMSPSFGGGSEAGGGVGFRVNDKIISLPCHAFMEEEHIQQVEEFLTEYKHYEY